MKDSKEFDMATLEKLRAEVRKLSAESDKLMMETRWYPMVLAIAMVTGLNVLFKVFA